MTTASGQKEELRRLRAELILRGWTLRKLAQKIGLAYGSVRNVLYGQHRGFGAKAAINSALGQEIFIKPAPTLRSGPRNRTRRPRAQANKHQPKVS
jgi:lambda repressor-like predicted transcriptional regulator